MKKTVCLILSVLFSALLFSETPIVQDIVAQSGNNKKINVIWTLPKNPDEEITEFLVYRSTKRISSYEQIRKIDPIASLKPNASGYVDSVSDYSDYYYAVITVTTKPYDLIMPTFNATVKGAHLPLAVPELTTKKEYSEKLYPEGTLREIPLPFLDLNTTTKDNQISEKATDIASTLTNKSYSLEQDLEPYFFEEDLISPDGGDDYLLFNILKTTLVQRKYKEAIKELKRLTGTNISDSTRNRAYFYLGESYYFLEEYEEAIKSFVNIRNVNPALVQEWLDSALYKSLINTSK